MIVRQSITHYAKVTVLLWTNVTRNLAWINLLLVMYLIKLYYFKVNCYDQNSKKKKLSKPFIQYYYKNSKHNVQIGIFTKILFFSVHVESLKIIYKALYEPCNLKGINL